MSRAFPSRLLLLLFALLGAAVLASLRFGTAPMPLQALLSAENGILAGRAFRTLCAALAGAALSVAGLWLQALTRNPLADPGITGINAGAALGAIGVAFLMPQAGMIAILAGTAAGASAAGVLLWRLGGGIDSMGHDGIALRLPLAGLAIGALALSLASAVILMDSEMQARYLRWLSGSVPAVQRGEALPLALIAVVLVPGWALCPRLEILGLGSESSASLGLSPARTILLTLSAVTVLCGAAVAITGPLAFLGLVVPFLARRLSGGDLGHAYLLCLPLGAAGLIFADLIGRLIARPAEVDAGIVLALLGGPAFIAVLRLTLRAPQEQS